jgi:hypothetical protein
MKKHTLMLAGLLLMASAAQAQLHQPAAIAVGIKAGGTVATFVGDASKLERSIYGFHAGLTFHLGEWQGLYVQPELLYSQKGSKHQESFYDLKSHLAYLDVPVPVRYQAGSFFAEAGPQLGILLSADVKSSLGGETTDTKDFYNSLDLGYVLGVGYQPVRGGLGAGIRYNGGFMRAPKDVETAQGPSETSLRNSAFQVYASYFLKSRRRR